MYNILARQVPLLMLNVNADHTANADSLTHTDLYVCNRHLAGGNQNRLRPRYTIKLIHVHVEI